MEQNNKILLIVAAVALIAVIAVLASTGNMTGKATYSTGEQQFSALQEPLPYSPGDCIKVIKIAKPDNEVRAGQPIKYIIEVKNFCNLSFNMENGNTLDVEDFLASDKQFQVIGYTAQLLPIYGPIGPPPYGYITPLCNVVRIAPAPMAAPSQEPAYTWELLCSGFVFPANSIMRLEIEAVGGYDLPPVPPTPPVPGQSINNNVQVLVNVGGQHWILPPPWANPAATQHDVTAVADLSLEKYLDEDDDGGKKLYYTLEVNNSGPSTAENVVLEDIIPKESVQVMFDIESGIGETGANLQEVYHDWTKDGCYQENGKLICGLGSIQPGQTVYVDLKIILDSNINAEKGDILFIDNSANVRSDAFDPDNSNNYLTNHAVLEPETDLESYLDCTLIEGGFIDCSGAVYNNGPFDSQDVYLVGGFEGDTTITRVATFQGECVSNVQLIQEELFASVSQSIKSKIQQYFEEPASTIFCSLGDLEVTKDAGWEMDVDGGAATFNFKASINGYNGVDNGYLPDVIACAYAVGTYDNYDYNNCWLCEYDGEYYCEQMYEECYPYYYNNCDYTDGCESTRSTGYYNNCDLYSDSYCGTETNCGDYINNDCDEYTDYCDSDCTTTEVCTGGYDEDCDGCTDAYDSNCGGKETGPFTPPSIQGANPCSDGYDNDCDGLTDCIGPGDPDCSCQQPQP